MKKVSLTVRDLLRIALRSEEEASLFYERLMDKTDNFFFKEKLEFLAKEEKKHRLVIIGLMKREGVSSAVDDSITALADLPSLLYKDSESLVSLIEVAMDAEKAACKFYQSLSEHVEGSDEKALLRYLSSMEASHYHMLEGKHEALLHLDDYDVLNDMMHEGP